MQNGKFALVTGASTGIGRAIAVGLGRLGYAVGLVGRRKADLIVTQRMIETAGGHASVHLCDLADVILVGSLIQTIERVDVLVNAAGIWHGENAAYVGKELSSFDKQVILDTYTVGFTAPTLLVHGLLPVMHRGGHIVNISGTFENGAGGLPYFASKRALEDLTLGLAEELKDKDIQVNCISPSDTATEAYLKYFPEDAAGSNSPEDVANLVVKVVQENQTGKFWAIKKGVATSGYHK